MNLVAVFVCNGRHGRPRECVLNDNHVVIYGVQRELDVVVTRTQHAVE